MPPSRTGGAVGERRVRTDHPAEPDGGANGADELEQNSPELNESIAGIDDVANKIALVDEHTSNDYIADTECGILYSSGRVPADTSDCAAEEK